jgi:outer membrane protein OmpA-like peptidoglycan-associated protein
VSFCDAAPPGRIAESADLAQKLAVTVPDAGAMTSRSWSRMRLPILAAAAAFALPVAAQAQPVEGFYVGAGAGLNWLQEQTFSGTGGADASFDLGFGGVISLGWGFGNGIRAEIEGSYRQNDVDQVARGTGRGTATSYGVMGNAFYDFHGLIAGIVPYVGVGAGYMWHEHDNVGIAGGPRSNGSDARFAYQAIVGAAIPIDAVPGLALTAEYRYMATLDQSIPNTFTRLGSSDVTPQNHSVFLGIRYAFGVAPVVAPAAAPEPARTYLVFFDWDRDTLTDRARQIIADAAANSRRVQTTRIEVSGHADRSGSPQYNQGLSQRRANNVAAELVRLGVPRNEITVQAFGESRPLVPTADNVREPQNRRVEIVLR